MGRNELTGPFCLRSTSMRTEAVALRIVLLPYVSAVACVYRSHREYDNTIVQLRPSTRERSGESPSAAHNSVRHSPMPDPPTRLANTLSRGSPLLANCVSGCSI
ncbi:hypothetical protein C8Q80DRAFT_222809 [Daedaleopsis nitida]|nr:hypothetical protein C8Q80DRAFT_222809 [Daedaleopsis nitida]